MEPEKGNVAYAALREESKALRAFSEALRAKARELSAASRVRRQRSAEAIARSKQVSSRIADRRREQAPRVAPGEATIETAAPPA
jgi:hypothetical protein